MITSDTVARQGNDVAPHYLPDGRIVFSSTRQRQSKAILLDEGKPQFDAQDEDRNEPAFVLHVMRADGTDIQQVSFNQSHDLDPAVLDDGRVVFTRWDGAPGHDEMSIYAMRPDGSGLELLYGANSHQTGTDNSTVQFLDPRPHGQWPPAGARAAIRRARAGRPTAGHRGTRTTWRTRSRPHPIAAYWPVPRRSPRPSTW